MDYDAIIIGSGHNGLVVAFYLARAGLRVLILEARPIVGGCCVTEELIPGFRFSTCANVLWGLRPKVVRDMALFQRGLVVEARQFIRLLPEGRYFYSGRLGSAGPGEDIHSLEAEIARFSQADAEMFPRWQAFLNRLTRIFGPYLLREPPQLSEIYASLTDPLDRDALDTLLTTSVASLGDRYFESDVMRDVGSSGDIGSAYDIGTGLGMGLLQALSTYSETGEPVANGYVRGGMGTITALMAEAAHDHGVEIRTAAPVAVIEVADGQAQGVKLVSGEQIRARVVIADTDPKRTFLKLVHASHLDAGFLRRVLGLRTEVSSALKLHCALSEFPEYRLAPGLSEEQIRRATVLIGSDRWHREASWRASQRGEISDDLIIATFMPSIYDPSLAPPGQYTWSAYIIWVPFQLRQGTWAERRQEVAERIFKTMDQHAANFSRSVLDYVLFTPADLESRMYLTDGNIHHVDAMSSQLLWQRPLPELAHYRAPIKNLYLCGAGMHPWGEVTGGPGHNAAHVILADLET